MKIRYYHNVFDNDHVHHQMTHDWGKSNTDRSAYRPTISDVRAFAGSDKGSSLQGQYDFPDGKDTGDRVQMLLRQKGLDQTEIDKIGQIVVDNMNQLQDQDKILAQKALMDKNTKDILKWAKKYIDNNAIPDAIAQAQSNSASVASSTATL